MTVIINGTTGVTFPNGVTMSDGTSAPVTVAQGGTGANTAANARTALGLAIGTDVLAPNGSGANLTSLNASAISAGTLASARLPSSGVNAASITTGTLAVAQGGTGTASPSLVGGTNITISGSWPNQTVTAGGGGVTSFNGNTGAIEGLQRLASGTLSGASGFTVTGLPSGYQFFTVVISANTGTSGGSTNYGIRISNNNGSSFPSSSFNSSGYFTISGDPQGTWSASNRSACLLYNDSYGISAYGSFNSVFTVFQRPSAGSGNNYMVNMTAESVFAISSNSPPSYNTSGCSRFASEDYYVNALQLVRLDGGVVLNGTYTVYGMRA